MLFFAIKFFLATLSAPFYGHRRCCDPAYGGPASRANNTGCLYLMYRMMRNMCPRPPRSAPLSCCPAAAGVLGAAAGCPIFRQRPGCRAADVASAGRFRAEARPHSSGGGVRRWYGYVTFVLSARLRCHSRRAAGLVGWGGWPCAMKKLRKKCRFSLSFANFTSKP